MPQPPRRRGGAAALPGRGDRRSTTCCATAGDGELQALYLAAGYPPRQWQLDQPTSRRRRWRRCRCWSCRTLLPSPASDAAKYVLPAATFAEKDGTFVNHAGLAQAIHWAVTPAGRVPHATARCSSTCWSAAAWSTPPTLRKELAAEVPLLRAAGWATSASTACGWSRRVAPASSSRRGADVAHGRTTSASHLVRPLITIVVVMGAIAGHLRATSILLERKISA